MNNKEDLGKEILKIVDWQSKARDSGLVDDMREHDVESHYQLYKIELPSPIGERYVLALKDQEKYELLQGSRGGSAPLQGDDDYSPDIKELMKSAQKQMEGYDWREDVRKEELDMLSESDRAPQFKFENIKSVAELGFRMPLLLKYYREKLGAKTIGYDVLDLNVATGKYLGYDARKYDFNICEDDLDLDVDLVISYHMIEHTTNPLVAVKKIYDSMKPGAYFHVEIPIEGHPERVPSLPNIRYCHLYPFHPFDLMHMLNIVGFNTIFWSKKTGVEGYEIERYFAQKPGENHDS